MITDSDKDTYDVVGELLIQWLGALTDDDRRLAAPHPRNLCKREGHGGFPWVIYRHRYQHTDGPGFGFIDNFPWPSSVYGQLFSPSDESIWDIMVRLEQRGLVVNRSWDGNWTAQLTQRGYDDARALMWSSKEDPRRQLQVSVELLRRIGGRRRKEDTKTNVDPAPLGDIFEFNYDFDRPPPSVHELFNAMQRLELEGLITVIPLEHIRPLPDYMTKIEPRTDHPATIYTDDLFGQLTGDGLVCLEEHGGDPSAMRKARSRGDDKRIFHVSGPTANLVIGDGTVTQYARDANQNASITVDVPAISRFAEAVAQAIPVLGLAPDQQQAAVEITSEIAELTDSRQPDHPKLRALGRTLRAILTGAAGNALGTGLLGLWNE